jgi:pyruvate dehydrogenase E1 component alpha subunit/2-oxoisovalerate dehydrogenase E1 component alpha subunit
MAKDKATATLRSGQLDCPSVLAWTDEAYARATGLVRVLDEDGHADADAVPPPAPATLRRLYQGMLRSRLLDEQLLPLQRQGRISHYFEARGQEAGPIAAAEAIDPTDYFVPGLREGAAALHRGLPLAAYLAQMLGTADDVSRGRQMPCHLASAAIRHVSTSSCVASQIPHAVGLAMAARIRREPTVAVCFFGDGATSEDDFHAGLNFAAVYQAPVVLVCQNNQWAISTPVAAQTCSETLAIKGLAYAIPSVRVDGNDVLAMYATIKTAVDSARAGGGPTFIEAVTYRLGAHASADDPTHYRDGSALAAWQKRDPLVRFGRWLADTGVLSAAAQAAARQGITDEIRAGIAAQEAVGRPEVASLFDDVYHQRTWLLDEQKAGRTGR